MWREPAIRKAKLPIKTILFRLLCIGVATYLSLWLVVLGIYVLEAPEPYNSMKLAITLYPYNAGAYYRMGETLANESMVPTVDRASASQPAYLKAVQLSPDFAEAHLKLGWTFWELKDQKAAESEFEKAIQLKPELREEVKTIIGNS
jgi:tetratricopeptide (TPR) repeat protein